MRFTTSRSGAPSAPWRWSKTWTAGSPVAGRSASWRPPSEELPDARLCFDVAHARQVDTSLTEAFLILERFGERLAQVHLSEVATSARHNRLSRAAILAFQELAPLIPADVPVILESPVEEDEIDDELARAEDALPLPGPAAAVG